MNDEVNSCPESSKINKAIRVGLNLAGCIPIAGGFLSAASGVWSEYEQDKINNFFRYCLQILQDELNEKEKTIIEIVQRLDLNDEKISDRIKSSEYQSLIKKCLRNWSNIDTENKRLYIRNILANAAATDVSTDDVVTLFITWINQYSELHFQVIACIYQNFQGISRGEVWDQIGKKMVREDSADADLYKLLIRDLSTGGIIRQHRQIDGFGRFAKKSLKKSNNSSFQIISAFDREELYELTALGKDFVHYAMTDIPIKIAYEPNFQ